MATRRGFTIVELLVTLGIIGLLVGILLPALSVVRGNAALAGSTSNMRQTFLLMGNYAAANRDTVVPSLFDHSQVAVKGKPRNEAGMPVGQRNMGTWADILWTDAGFGPIVMDDGGSTYDYRADAPDGTVWQRLGDFERGPLRSTVQARTVFGGNMSMDGGINNNDYGSRAITPVESGLFAANNFFDARPGQIGADGLHSRRRNTNHPFDARVDSTSGRVAASQPMQAGASPAVQFSLYFTQGQILRPDSSAYLIDSIAGETIDPVDDHATDVAPFHATEPDQVQVGFRYPGDTCAMLMLDGHVRTEQRWDELLDLEGFANDRLANGQLRSGDATSRKDQGRGIRFRHLDQR
ncbi:MAG: hypothetical protein RLZZ558_235 [Planctomycetota bacterium]